MVAIPRGDEEFRFTFFEATAPDGKRVAWHEFRVFQKNEVGEWVRGKAGVTVRGRELAAIRDALIKATSGGRAK
jgi:hypothetical protein